MTTYTPAFMPADRLNIMAAEVHKENERWWVDLDTGERLVRNVGELFMLVISELTEALEGERKGLMDDHLPHRRMAEVEMADTVIRLLDTAAGYGYEFYPYERHAFTSAGAWGTNCGEMLWRITVAVNIAADHMRLHQNYIRSGGKDAKSDRLLCDEALTMCIRSVEFYCAQHGYDLWGAVAEKRAYNQRRADHTLAARKAAGGKKF